MYRVRELWSIGILEKSPWPRHGASVYGGEGDQSEPIP